MGVWWRECIRGSGGVLTTPPHEQSDGRHPEVYIQQRGDVFSLLGAKDMTGCAVSLWSFAVPLSLRQESWVVDRVEKYEHYGQ